MAAMNVSPSPSTLRCGERTRPTSRGIRRGLSGEIADPVFFTERHRVIASSRLPATDRLPDTQPFMRRLLALLALAPAALSAQPASIVYRLGKDTVAIEQYTRTPTSLTGEMVQRSGAAVARVLYSMTIGKNGRPTAASIMRLAADGSLPPNTPMETRFTITADSIVREAVFADSVQRRAFAAKQAFVNFPVFVYGPFEVLAAIRKSGSAVDSLPALGATGNLGYTGLAAMSGDSVRLKGAPYAMIVRLDGAQRLLGVDGALTTNKSIGTRGAAGADLAAIAKTMKPTGVLSLRETARGAFGQGGIVLVDYGRPQVRERSVWGGTLVPFDSVWRTGANDATHLFTTRVLTFGAPGAELVVPPGQYTLFVQHTRTGTWLIVNRQTGQWGTVYNAANDLGRVPMTLASTAAHVEEFTITVKSLSPARGALELAWGPGVASVPFGVRVARP